MFFQGVVNNSCGSEMYFIIASTEEKAKDFIESERVSYNGTSARITLLESGSAMPSSIVNRLDFDTIVHVE